MFEPIFSITPSIAKFLMKLEALKKELNSGSPVSENVDTALVSYIHYVAKIEGNRLSFEEVHTVMNGGLVLGKDRDVNQIFGLTAAIKEMYRLAKQQTIDLEEVQHLHALITGGGAKQIRPTSFRIAEDVPAYTTDLLHWMSRASYYDIPEPIVAAIVLHRFMIIQPFAVANGIVACLLVLLILYQAGYRESGIYYLPEFFAQDTAVISASLSSGHCLAEPDLTAWVEYFCRCMHAGFEKAKQMLSHEQRQSKDIVPVLRVLDSRQRALLQLFAQQRVITARDVGKLFNIKPRTARHLCQRWGQDGFLIITDPSKKARTYALVESYRGLI